MKKPPKPSHQLNLEAVKNWAKSLSPNDRAQWLDSLVERDRERSADASDASLRHSGDAGELSQQVLSEGGRSSAASDAMKKPHRPSRAVKTWAESVSHPVSERDREHSKEPTAQQDRQAPPEQEAQALEVEQEALELELELEQVAQALAQALEQKGS